jgi:putative spermidine/putrescine transport system ATP-binding protein
VSDRVAVMYGGRIEQVGSPAEMYGSPATPFVAEFIGTMNRLVSTVADDGYVEYGDSRLRVQAADGLPRGERVLLLVRPETVVLERVGEGTPANGSVVGDVVSHIFLGSVTRVRIEEPGSDRGLTADISPVLAEELVVGTRVSASFPPAGARLLSLADQPESYGPDPDSQ